MVNVRLGQGAIVANPSCSTIICLVAAMPLHQHAKDQVPPFPLEAAVKIVEEELGSSVNKIFDQFNSEPIAAASLGQVHWARLNGIKVQRLGLKGLFDIDLKNLRVIAEYLQKVDPKSDSAKKGCIM